MGGPSLKGENIDTGEQIEVPSVGKDPAMGLTFYAALLPRLAWPTLVKAFDGEGWAIAQSPLHSLR